MRDFIKKCLREGSVRSKIHLLAIDDEGEAVLAARPVSRVILSEAKDQRTGTVILSEAKEQTTGTVILSEAKELAFCIYSRCRHIAMINSQQSRPFASLWMTMECGCVGSEGK